eukprot:12891013-Ditylum_brightwellii.AAC.1
MVLKNSAANVCKVGVETKVVHQFSAFVLELLEPGELFEVIARLKGTFDLARPGDKVFVGVATFQ